MLKRLLPLNALAFLCGLSMVLNAQSEQDLSAQFFTDQLRVLSHDSLEGRGTLKNGIRKARRLIQKEMGMLGIHQLAEFPDYLQEVPMSFSTPPTGIQIKAGSGQIAGMDQIVVVSGKSGDITGEVVFIEQWPEHTQDLPEVVGKIVVTPIGGGSQNHPMAWLSSGADKKADLKASGAIGLIELYEPGRFPWQMIRNFLGSAKLTLDRGQASMDHLWVNLSDTSTIRQITKPGIKITIKVEGYQQERMVDYNIAGFLPGTDPELADEFILFSAHYDHLGIGKPDMAGDSIYNGTRDNAIGTASILGLMHHFKANPSPRPLLFVFYTAEEKGLLGSEYFIDHCPIPMNRIRFNFNCDNGGYTDTDIVTMIGFHKLNGLDDIDDWIASSGLHHFESVEMGSMLFFQSDNIHFAKRGIPAPTFGLGFTGFTESLLKYYHKAGDHFENFDPVYMQRYWTATQAIADHLVRMTNLPFWKPEEPFYETGKALYGL